MSQLEVVEFASQEAIADRRLSKMVSDLTLALSEAKLEKMRLEDELHKIENALVRRRRAVKVVLTTEGSTDGERYEAKKFLRKTSIILAEAKKD